VHISARPRFAKRLSPGDHSVDIDVQRGLSSSLKLIPSLLKAEGSCPERIAFPATMSALVKAKLKAARDAIGKKDYAAAQVAALQALDFESDNYNACVVCALPFEHDPELSYRNVFLGLASLELGNHEQSEQVITPSSLPGRHINMLLAGISTCDRSFTRARLSLAGAPPR
jgi:hypothetical protein